MYKMRHRCTHDAAQRDGQKNKQGVIDGQRWYITVEYNHDEEQQRSADEGGPVIRYGVESTPLNENGDNLSGDFALRFLDGRFDSLKILICKSFMNGHDERVKIKDNVLTGINSC